MWSTMMRAIPNIVTLVLWVHSRGYCLLDEAEKLGMGGIFAFTLGKIVTFFCFQLFPIRFSQALNTQEMKLSLKTTRIAYHFAVGKICSLQSNFIESTIRAFCEVLGLNNDTILLSENNVALSIDVNFFSGISLQLQCTENTSFDVQNVECLAFSWEQLVDSALRSLEDKVLSSKLSWKFRRLWCSLENLVLALYKELWVVDLEKAKRFSMLNKHNHALWWRTTNLLQSFQQ